ncbi:MAG: polyprenyl synthetase family protein [bacterium]|nr:polyprenyl synthetase family protein [bacterium]
MTLEEIFQPISKELQLVEKQLKLQLKHISHDRNISQYQQGYVDLSIDHLFKTVGKRLRPALVLLSAKFVGPVDTEEPSNQSVVQLATAVELVHSASLIHDDILDEALHRRGQLSLNEKCGNKIAVIVGDLLFSQAFSILLNLEIADWQKKQKIFHIFCNTIKKMCLGEIFQRQIITDRRSAEFGEYLAIIENKTAILMSACCQCGAMLAGKDEIAPQNLATFGLQFGLAFQLADDFKDQDALLKKEMDLFPLTKDYIEKAKASLQSVNGNTVRKHLTALCDFLLPASGG